MVNAFMTGIAIGAGMLVGAAGLAGAGYVAYRYEQIQYYNSPIAIDARNEEYFLKPQTNINNARHNDVQHCMDIYDSYAGRDPNYGKYVSDCAVSYGWDRTDTGDLVQQYDKVMRVKIKAAWVGDQNWIDKKLNEYYKD